MFGAPVIFYFLADCLKKDSFQNLKSEVNFIKVLQAVFTCSDPESAKMTDGLTVHICRRKLRESGNWGNL